MSRRAVFRRVAFRFLAPSCLLLLAVAAGRYWFGVVFGVSVLVVEGLHAVIDFFVTVAVVAALVVLYSGFARRFPYGLFRAEDLAALGLSLVIGFSGFEMLLKCFELPGEMPLSALLVQGLSLPLFLASAWLKLAAGRELGSPSLRADAVHSVIDVVEGGGVLAGIFLYYASGYRLAYAGSMVVASLGLLAAAVEVGWDSLHALLDLPRDPRFLGEAVRLAEEVGGAEVVGARARWAGSVVFLELRIRLHPLYTIEDAYVVSRRVRRALLSHFGFVEDVVVSVEPTARRSMVVALPQEECGLEKPLSEHFGRAPWFLVVRVVDGEIEGFECVQNPRKGRKPSDGLSKFLVGADVAESLKSKGVTDVVAVNIGEIAFSILLRHSVVVWKGAKEVSARETVERLIEGELSRLKAPTREEAWRKFR